MDPAIFDCVKGLNELPIAWNQLLDEIPIAILVIDPSRRIMYINRALEALTGFDSAAACGIPCWYVLRGNLCGQECQALQLDEIPCPFSVTGDIVNAARQKIQVRMTRSPMRDLSGNLVGFIESVEDLRPLAGQLNGSGRSSTSSKLVGASSEFQRVLRSIPSVAESDWSVLVTGERGTGKDVIAHALHGASRRAKGPFIKIDCSAMPERILESELFGHEKGAFPAAVESKPGRLLLANNGTAYLSNVDELPAGLQERLLSFLDDKVVRSVGSAKPVLVDVRLISSTARDLEQMAREGRFRKELLFRLNVTRLHLPPLHKRGADVRMLLDHFLHEFSKRYEKRIGGFSDSARDIMMGYRYPGNVMELRNIVEYAVSLCEDTLIQSKHIPLYIQENETSEQGPSHYQDDLDAELLTHGSERSAHPSWADTEQQMILEAMVKARGRRTEAARILGWGRSTLWRKMKRYGIGS